MGFARNRELELAYRGHGEIEGALCLDHATDACLARRLEEFATQEDCVVCGRACAAGDDAPFAVPLKQPMGVVIETLRHFYANAVEVLPWDNEWRTTLRNDLVDRDDCASRDSLVGDGALHVPCRRRSAAYCNTPTQTQRPRTIFGS
jgi:hypothetical protein